VKNFMTAESVDLLDSDHALERRVENFLAMCGIPGAKRLGVRATEGVVTVSGIVSSFYQRQLCTHACRRVAGVHRLIDQIAVVESAVNRRQPLKVAV
jgi:osmotically-inducible protein OsmY